MPQQEREELMQLVEQVREASMKEEKLDKLAEAMIEDADDPDAIEDAVRRLDIDPNDLMSRSRESASARMGLFPAAGRRLAEPGLGGGMFVASLFDLPRL